MKTLKLSLIAVAAIMLTSCGSKTEKAESADRYGAETEVTTEAVAEDNDNEEVVESTSNSSGDIDRLLDAYEEYMDEYIKLAKKAMNGDMSAINDYPELLEKAEQLEKELDEEADDMTPAQLARFQKISAKAASAMM